MVFISFQIKELQRIHNAISSDHAGRQPIIQLSLDGIMESKSSINSLDVYSLTFNHCRNIYPLRIIKPCEKFKFDEQNELQQVLNDINENEVVIDCCVLDNPKRGTVKCAKTACAKHACEYCESCAVPYVDINKKSLEMVRRKYELSEKKINKEIEQLEAQNQENSPNNEYLEHLRKSLENLHVEKETELKKNSRKHLTWPASTMNGTLRTIDKIKEIVKKIEEDPNILKNNPDFCKGIKGRSLMLDQPFFDFIKDIATEYMHLVCLGVVKRMLILNFKVGENRDRITKRKLSSPSLFNEKIKLIQLTREFSRRCRNMDLSVMKASEYRNILIFLFPIVLDCIEDEFKDDKRVWLHLVYMIRACILPNNEFRKIDENNVRSACEKFYTLYEKLYGQHNCTYSVHVVGSHLLKFRGNRPLTYKSAFKFESFFAEMRNLFQPGTTSPLKQILQNGFMKRMLEFHSCEKNIYYCPESQKTQTLKENNSLIYTYDENETLTMFKIVDKIDDNLFRCHKQGKFKAKTPLTPEYDWSEVGVFKVGPVSDEGHVVHKDTISGKVIKVNEHLITCPNNVLLEQ